MLENNNQSQKFMMEELEDKQIEAIRGGIEASVQINYSEEELRQRKLSGLTAKEALSFFNVDLYPDYD